MTEDREKKINIGIKLAAIRKLKKSQLKNIDKLPRADLCTTFCALHSTCRPFIWQNVSDMIKYVRMDMKT